MFRICLIWILGSRNPTRTFCKFWTLNFLHAFSFKHRNFLRWTIFFVCFATEIHRFVYSYAVFMKFEKSLWSRSSHSAMTWKIIVIVIFASSILSFRFLSVCIKNLKIIFVNDSEKAWFDDSTVCCFQDLEFDFVQFTVFVWWLTANWWQWNLNLSQFLSFYLFIFLFRISMSTS